MDEFFATLRRAGLLLEFSEAEWRQYAQRHFGPDARFSFPPGAEPQDLGFSDKHCVERGNYIEPRLDTSDPVYL